jgi:anti-anti-sigma factor
MRDIHYSVEEKGNFYILRMSGAINARTLLRYRKIVDDLMIKLDVRNKKELRFIVDYGGIVDIDSSALANILDRLKNDVRSDHKVAFIHVPEKFKSMVDLHKMGDIIHIYGSDEEAMAALE